MSKLLRNHEERAASRQPQGAQDESALDPNFRTVVRKLLIDRFTAEVTTRFIQDGIEVLVLKGPVLAEWLYPGEVRGYCDSDLMVAPDCREGAASILEELGFIEYRPWMPS